MNMLKHAHFILTWWMLVSLLGCAGLAKKAPPLTLQGSNQVLRPGDIVDTSTGETISFADLMERLAEVRVIYVGENHTRIEDHRIQRQVLQGLYERNPHVVLAMEMFPREKQAVLDRYSAGRIREQALLEEAEWSKVWGYPFQLYGPLLTWAAEKRLRIIGLNAPPEVVRKIGRSGLPSLTAQERNRIAKEIDLNDSAHRAYVREEYERHTKESIKEFQSFYEAQLAWEETMAETLARALSSADRRQQVVVLIGTGHIFRRFGVPQRAWKRFEHEYKTILPIPIDDPDRVIDPGIADYLWVTRESTGFHHRGLLGIMVAPSATGKGVEIKGVVPGGPAAEAGIEKGDLLYEFDGMPVDSVEDIHRAVASGGGKTHRLSLERGGKEMNVKVKLSP